MTFYPELAIFRSMADLPRASNMRIVGQVNDVVYYYRLGVPTQRAHFIPVQPGTNDQLDWWDVFRDGVNAWHDLSQQDKDKLDEKAKPLQMSGFNLHMRKYLKSHKLL